MQIYFNASALHILYIILRISRATDLQIYSEKIFDGFHVVSPWFPTVPRGYPWLSLVILGYLQFKYMWNRLRIYNYSFRQLQKSSAVAARQNDHEVTMYTQGNQRKPQEGLNGKGASDSPSIYDLNRRIYTHYTHCFIH